MKHHKQKSKKDQKAEAVVFYIQRFRETRKCRRSVWIFWHLLPNRVWM